MAGTTPRPKRLEGQDDRAFRAFYEEAFPRVYAYLLRRVGNSDTAADLTQAAFTAALGEVRAGHVDAVSLPWLYGIARHKLVDDYRRAGRERRKLALLARSPGAGAGPRRAPSEPAGEPPALFFDDPAWQALRRLPPLQRAALVLHYLDDLPVADVATHLRRSVHATESLLARGRQAFRAAYEEVSDVA